MNAKHHSIDVLGLPSQTHSPIRYHLKTFLVMEVGQQLGLVQVEVGQELGRLGTQVLASE